MMVHPYRRPLTADHRPLLTAALLLGPLLAGGCTINDSAVVAQAGSCRMAQPLVFMPEVVGESSGAAMSRARPGLIWTHNDSGGEVALFGVGVDGQLVSQVALQGASNIDWEDVSSGECGDGDCLYVADIGDNGAERSDLVIYRIREPAGVGASVARADALPIRYPGGPRDAEAIFVLPGERLYVVTKGENSAIEIFRYPGTPRPGVQVELEPVRRLSEGVVPRPDRVTAASANPEGTRVALRTLQTVLIYDAEDLVANEPTTPANVDVSTFGEAQGEGLAYGPNGAIVLTSEGGDGMGSSLGILWCP